MYKVVHSVWCKTYKYILITKIIINFANYVFIIYYINTSILVSEATEIIVIYEINNRSTYNSISKCAETLNISKCTIRQCLNTGKSYKGYIFALN